MDYSGGKYPRWLSSSNTVVTIKAPSVENLTNNGNSQLEMNLENQSSFNLVTEGNPNIILTGKIAILNLQSSGNAAIKAGNLLTEKIILSADGNSDIEVNTKELIEKSVKGNNDISNFFYKTKKEVVSEDENTVSKKEFIHFKLKNNSLLPVKVIVISYRPDEKGNGTTAYWLLPYASKSYSFPAETSVYLANQNQVDAVMSGAKINDQTPFLVVKKEDEGKSFDIK